MSHEDSDRAGRLALRSEAQAEGDHGELQAEAQGQDTTGSAVSSGATGAGLEPERQAAQFPEGLVREASARPWSQWLRMSHRGRMRDLAGAMGRSEVMRAVADEMPLPRNIMQRAQGSH